MHLATSVVVVLLLTFLVMGVTHASKVALDIRMPGVSPRQPDTYLCVASKIPPGNQYIVKYEPEADMRVVHHILVYGCGAPVKKAGHWDCKSVTTPKCSGNKSAILYAWALNAGPLEMPANTGMHVGGSSGYNYIVIEVHYLHVKQFRYGHTDHSGIKITLDSSQKKHLAGVYLVANAITWSNSIPPHVKKYHMDAGCTYRRYTQGPIFYAFRFRVHTHSLGSVVTGYRVRNGNWTLIGRGDPQEPEAFNPTTSVIDIKPGDNLMMRCTFNSSSRKRLTHIGPTHIDEMCRLYIMYYCDASNHGEISSLPCETSQFTERRLKTSLTYPDDSDMPKNNKNPLTGRSSQKDGIPNLVEGLIEE